MGLIRKKERTMKNRYLSLCITGLLVASCSIQEMDTAGNRRSRDSFFARIESPGQTETKAFVDDQLRVLWDENDHVSIFDKYTFNREYRFTGTTGDNAGTFDKIETGDFVTGNELDLVYSVYPYREDTRIDNDGVLSVTLPARQAYREKSFGPGANTMVSCTDGDELMFKNLCGYLMLKLYGDEVTVSTLSIQGNGEEGLAGRARVYSSPGEAPSLSLDESSTRIITITMDQAVRLGSSEPDATVFWVVIPPVTFSQGFTLTVKDPSGNVYTKKASSPIKIERNTITHMQTLRLEAEAVAFPYVDEYGVDRGAGVTVDGITWAPVNCGYKPATGDSKGFPYGKLYQYGRRYGQGYGEPYFGDPDGYEDESLPNYDPQWNGNNEDTDANTFYFGVFDPYDWILNGRQFWNDGTESEPKKNSLYDPCPDGWRIPTATELSTLGNGYQSDIVEVDGIYGVWYSGSKAYDEQLKEKVFLPAGGARSADFFDHGYGAFGRGTSGHYWSSSIDGSGSRKLGLLEDPAIGSTYRAFGFSVRCCRDESSADPGTVPVSSITLDKTALTLAPGNSETLLATVLPDNATDKTVTWTSSNTSVATVSNGTVTALAAGTATITASAGGKLATCEVTVPETSIEDMVKVYFSGVDISSGSMSWEGSYWKLTAGVKLSVRISNTSSRTITLSSIRLTCANTGYSMDSSLNNEVGAGRTLGFTITLPRTFYSPIAEFTYQCEGATYTASAQYNGSF